MKFGLNLTVGLLLTTLSLSAFANELTDEMALEDGMTPIEEMQDIVSPEFNFERSEYVSTIPSADDIERVIQSNRQVIVVNKANNRKRDKNSQTLRVYRNGIIVPLMEDGKSKDFVNISTGREKAETAKSGRKYFSTTPKGFFRPQRVYSMYYSNTWKADMPNAVFFCQNFAKECGIAIHATTKSHYPELGTRDSGGCVRTKLEVSKQIRELVMDSGLGRDNHGTVTESYRRNRITNNSILVDQIGLMSGDLGPKVKSWDTIIVVYE